MREGSGADFYPRLGDAFIYPFRGDGRYLLLVGTVFFWLAQVLSAVPLLGIAVAVITALYLGAFLLEVMSSSAAGDEELPSWPDVSDFWDNIVRPCLLALFSVLFSALPVIGVAVVGWRTSWQPAAWAWVAAGVVSGLYLPMSLLVVNLTGSILAMNPAVIIPSIARVPLQYLAACVVLALMVVLRGFVGDMLGRVVILGSLLNVFFSLYFSAVEMRILGIIYHANRHRLGWFE